MIGSGIFTVEPWAVTEPELHLDLLGETESIFSLSNGHIGLRGNLDEGEPHIAPGTYLNGFYETLPLPYAETGYGYPEQGQSLINVTDGKITRLLIDDELFDVRHGTLKRHIRTLDMRAGVLRREVEWVSAAGQGVRVRTTRLVSFVHRAIAAVRMEVEPIDDAARVVVQSVLIPNEPLAERRDDPRAAAALRAPLVCDYVYQNGSEVSLGHHTQGSGLRMAAGLDHVIDGPPGTEHSAEARDDLGRVTISTELKPGEKLTVVKFMAYAWSSVRSMPSLRDQVDAALAAARHTGWDGLVRGQREYLDQFWRHAIVEIDGDPVLQQAIRFALFQVIQSAARAEKRAIPAKGLTGRGYDGHTFWDQEMYVLPVLTYTSPNAARDALLWRHSTLPQAKQRAKELRLQGAAFPWRTIGGSECSGYWPAGTAAFHVNADIAEAVRRYVRATGDEEFGMGPGFDLVIETARLWASLGHHDAEGNFRIDGVTGPDEYSALADNNTFTNLMAARNLRVAADLAEQYPVRADELGVTATEIAEWRKAADTIVIPFDHEQGITAQAEGFTRYRRWDFEATPHTDYPLLLHYPYYLLYSSQVVKQADLVFALYICSECFSDEQKRRDFEYYEAITVRDSTLSACIQAIVAAEVGYLDLAYQYVRESALVDLARIAGNTEDGLHLASLAGSWLGVVAGFGGMRDHGEVLSFAPRLPRQLQRVAFHLRFKDNCLRVEITPEEVRYTLMEGSGLEFDHVGTRLSIRVGEPIVMKPAPVYQPDPPRAAPPPGRAPLQWGIGREG